MKPPRTSHESPKQSNSSIDTKSQLPEVRRSESSEGITRSKSYEPEEDDNEALESSVLRQPYLQKYLVGEHFKTHQQPKVKHSPSPKSQPVQSQFVVPKTTPTLSSSPPSYAEVRSRNSARNKENIPSERTRPKSLITDQPSASREGSSSTEIKPSVRTSSSDTQLVTATQIDKAPQNNVPYYQQRYVQEEQVIKSTFKPPQNQAPILSDSDKVKSEMSRSAYEFQSPMQQSFQQETPMYDKPQQRNTNRFQQPSQPQPAHYNQIYGEQPPIRYHGQQQISPKNEQYQQQPRYASTNSQAYDMTPTMSTSMYDFNRPPPTNVNVMTHSDIDDSTIHSNLSRSQTALHPYQNAVVQHQRHTIQRPPQTTATASRMPNSHSVDSGLFHMRAQNQAAAVSNPVYGSTVVHDAKRAHVHSTTQRHWLVDEALRRQQAEMEAQRRRNQEQEIQRRQQADMEAQRRQQAEMEAQRRQQAEIEAQRRQQAEMEAQRRQQAEIEAQRRQHEIEAQRRQQVELDAQKRQKTDMRKGHAQMMPQKSSSEFPPALPPRMKSSAAIAAMQRPRPVLNSRAPCCACNQPLGTGDLMTIESLHLSFHLTCFRCIVCQTMLGSGRQDADVRVRGSRLYCFNCSALEEGTGGGGNLSRRGGGRY